MWKLHKSQFLHCQLFASIIGKTCFGPDDMKEKFTSRLSTEAILRSNCQAAGLKFHGSTPTDGNCFFHAIADQLHLHHTKSYSHEELRKMTVDYIQQHKSIQVLRLKMLLVWNSIIIIMLNNIIANCNPICFTVFTPQQQVVCMNIRCFCVCDREVKDLWSWRILCRTVT